MSQILNRRQFVAAGISSAALAHSASAQSSKIASSPGDGRQILLTSPVVWNAHWIAPKGMSETANVFFRARKSFQLPLGKAVPDSFLLHIAAESVYRLYVNGQVVGEGPVRGSHTLNFYDSFETAPLLREGENWIAVLVHCMNVPSFKYAPAQPGFVLQASGGTLVSYAVVSDSSWRVQDAPDWRRDVPLFSHQNGFIEWRDLRKEPAGWQEGRDRSVWDSPEIIAPADAMRSKRLLPRAIPPLAVTKHLAAGVPIVAALPPVTQPGDTDVARLLTEEPHEPLVLATATLMQPDSAPLAIPPQAGGRGVTLIADFGQDFAGGFELEINAPSGTVVDIGYEEQIRDDRLKLALGNFRFADRFILRGGRQTIANSHERGFRFLQLALREFHEPIEIHALGAVDRRYPVVSRGDFHCSDALINSIYSACALTLSTCATDTFIDCPWREMSFWVNDLLVENVAFLQAFGDARLNARCLRLALSEQRGDGLIPGVCPSEGKEHQVLIATNLFVPLMIEEYWLYAGDRKLVEETMPAILRILQAFAKWQDSEGLVTPPKQFWNFVDWSYAKVNLDGRCTAVISFLHVLALDSTARLLRRLGHGGDPDALEAEARRIAQAADTRFWDSAKHCYAEWVEKDAPASLHSQLSHAVAVLSGRVPEAHRDAAAAALDRDDLLPTELYLSHLVFRALAETGQTRAALDRIRRFWGPIVLSPSPTIWEMGVAAPLGKEAVSGRGSLCHGFATTPISFLQSTVLGVRPLSPGFERFSVAPHPCDLSFASGSIPTPKGNIEIGWKRTGPVMKVELRLPTDTKAELPDGRVLDPGLHRFELPVG